MRTINKIIIHCTATAEGKNHTVDEIRRWHVDGEGWNDIGYHFVIYLDGSIHLGRKLERAGAHTYSHNTNSIGIVYVGGCAADGKTPKDTRTPEQKRALLSLVKELKHQYPDATIHGHREFAKKACPSFDVQKWLKEVGL